MKSFLLIALVGAVLLAQDSPEKKKFEKRKLSDRQWVEGKIVCIGCELEDQDGGAESQCTLFAKHAQGLKLANGTIWTLVNNQRGNSVITNDKLRGKDAKIFGWKFPKSQYIELWRYQLREGEKWVDYDFCKNCGFEKGDNKDKDLCEDCEK